MRCLASLVLLALAAPSAAEERRAMISGFDRIRVEGPFAVTVTTGASPGAVTSGERRALDSVNVRVSGTTLVISAGVNGWGGYPGAAREVPSVAVTVPALRAASLTGGGTIDIAQMRGQRVELSLAGAGAIRVAAADADRLDAIVVGTGSLNIAGRAAQARFQANGAATIDAAALSAGTLVVVTQGAGDSSFSARTSATVTAQGQGRVTVTGTGACTVRGTAPVVCGVE